MEVMQEGASAQNKSPGVTDGVAEREGNQLSLKVFHLFFISGRRLKAHFLMTEPARLTLWLCKAPERCVFEFYYIFMKLSVCTDYQLTVELAVRFRLVCSL